MMTTFQLNWDGNRRDSLIFGTPLDWQSERTQHQQVRFSKLAVFQLADLLAEGFLEPEVSSVNPVAPQLLLNFAHACIEAGLQCEFEGEVSTPELHQSVAIARMWIKGAITQSIRAAFWQAFQQVDTLQISGFELRATWGEAWLYHPFRTAAAYPRSDGAML